MTGDQERGVVIDMEARAAAAAGITVLQYRNRQEHNQMTRYCPLCGDVLDLLNISADHWMACRGCRVKTLWGGNIFSWSHENETIWQRNAAFLETCRELTTAELYGTTITEGATP